MRAAIYLRQSLDRDETEDAVNRQRQDCERLCAARGWDVVRVFNENDTSASNGKRKKYEAMLEAIRRGDFDIVVCWHVDRLTRKLIELEQIIELAEATGVKIATVSGDIDMSNDMGRQVGRMLAVMARGEVERKSARQKRAAVQAAEQGKLPGGPAPFGWRKDGTHDPTQAKLLREAYRTIIAGGSLKGIAADWNQRGVASSPRRKLKSGKVVGGEARWNHTTLRRRLLDPRNGGFRALNGVIVGKGDWKPIVDPDTFHAVKNVLDNPTRRTTQGPYARQHLLSALALCGRCERVMVVITGRTDRGVRTYRCRTGHLSRKAEPIDDLIEKIVVARMSRPDAVELLRRDDTPDTDALDQRATVLNHRLDDLSTALSEGVLTLDGARRESKRLRAELATVEAMLHEPSKAAVLADLVKADDPAKAWAGLDLDRRRSAIDVLMTITLLPVPKGSRRFDPASIDVAWR